MLWLHTYIYIYITYITYIQNIHIYIYTATDEITCFSENAITKGGGGPLSVLPAFPYWGIGFWGFPIDI